MPVTTGFSTKPLTEAVGELRSQCHEGSPRLVLFFASSHYDLPGLSKQMQGAFADSEVVGCSTAGEIVSGKMLTGSVVAMFLPRDTVEDAAVVVVENLQSAEAGLSACSAFGQYFRTPVKSLDLQHHVGLVLVDGLSRAEERLMERIGDCSDLFFIGGSAGDDLRFKRTYVCASGKAYTDAAVLVVLRLRNGFEILKTQSFVLAGKRLVATKVEESERRVLQFDHRPALRAYAEAIGVPPDEAATFFMEHPLGLMVNGEPFVRSPQRVEGESIVFYSRIKKGMQLEVLQSTDIVADTRAAIAKKEAALGHISGLIDFHCILRTLDLRRQRRCDEYGAIFSAIPTIGFSTYGEEYLGHMNQTSTMLLFR